MNVNSTNNNVNMATKVAKIGGIGAAVGATIQGVTSYVGQRNILKNGDEYLTRLGGQIANEKTFCKPFFKGTQEAADLAIKNLDKQFDAAKQFIANGKVDFKAVAKRAGVGALVAGATWAGIALIVQLCKKVDSKAE